MQNLKRQQEINLLSLSLSSSNEQDEWLQRKCDKYFCKPHRLSGRGLYRCAPLDTDPKSGDGTDTGSTLMRKISFLRNGGRL